MPEETLRDEERGGEMSPVRNLSLHYIVYIDLAKSTVVLYINTNQHFVDVYSPTDCTGATMVV